MNPPMYTFLCYSEVGYEKKKKKTALGPTPISTFMGTFTSGNPG